MIYYCEACRRKWRWPRTESQSIGLCTVCGKPGNCFNAYVTELADPVGIFTEEETASHAQTFPE